MTSGCVDKCRDAKSQNLTVEKYWVCKNIEKFLFIIVLGVNGRYWLLKKVFTIRISVITL